MDYLPENYREEIRQAYSGYQLSPADMEGLGRLYHWIPPDFDVERTNTELAIIAGCLPPESSIPETAFLAEEKDAREFVI